MQAQGPHPFSGTTLDMAMEGLLAIGFGTVLGLFAGMMLMALGYVYGDAQQRGMPAFVWLLVALLMPGFLGFVLYLLLRKPFVEPCLQCGKATADDDSFCRWCGALKPRETYARQASAPPPPWDPRATV
jgi:hypothetical protein